MYIFKGGKVRPYRTISKRYITHFYKKNTAVKRMLDGGAVVLRENDYTFWLYRSPRRTRCS